MDESGSDRPTSYSVPLGLSSLACALLSLFLSRGGAEILAIPAIGASILLGLAGCVRGLIECLSTKRYGAAPVFGLLLSLAGTAGGGLMAAVFYMIMHAGYPAGMLLVQ